MMRPWGLVLGVLVVYLAMIYAANSQDAQAFVTPGTCFSACQGRPECPIPANTPPEAQLALEGYDGQFAYYIARDPAHAAPCLDVPAYRYQRILLPLLGYGLSLGDVRALPWIFVALNGLALVASTRLLEDLLTAQARRRWFALGYGLFFGLVVGVRLSTPEPLAYGLVVGALWAAQRDYSGWVIVALALAAFAKETTGIMTAGFALWYAWGGRWRMLAALVLGVGVPFMAWQAALYVWLGAVGLGSGGAGASGFELIPFMGVLKIWTEGGLVAFVLLGVLLVGVPVVLPTLWALYQTGRDATRGSLTLYSCVLFTSAAIMPFVPFSTYRETLGIYRFIPGLVLMVILYSAERDLARPLMYSTLWLVLLLFLSLG